MSRKNSRKDPPLVNLTEGDEPIKGETCFKTHQSFNVNCKMTDCRYWQEMNGAGQNCVINAANSGPLTLQEVGNIFSVTRMRICQIEKSAKEILKSMWEKNESVT